MRDSIRILIVQPFDSLGSIQRRSLRIAEIMRTQNIETVFVVPHGGSSFSKELLRRGFKVYKTRITRPVLLGSLRNIKLMIEWLVKLPLGALEFRRIINAEKPDVVQTNGLVCVQESLVSALQVRNRFIWNLIGNMYPRLVVLLLSPIIRRASMRVLVTKKLVQYYSVTPDYRVIYESVDTELFDSATPQQVSPLSAAKPNHHLIGFVGTVTPVKGLEYLIHGFSMLREEGIPVNLVVVGSPSLNQMGYMKRIQKLVVELGIEDDVIFTGRVENSLLPGILSQLDVFVLPSKSEGTPVSILEAMAMELPVVATDVGGISELVVNGETGIIVEPMNSPSIASAIAFLLQNPAERTRMGRSGRQRVLDLFTFDKTVTGYTEVYHETARKHQDSNQN